MSTKESVLALLTQNLNKPVSGEKLASECGVSRAAIWKTIQVLRETGFSIEGTTNGGYVLTDDADILNECIIKEYLNQIEKKISGYKIKCFNQLDSTSTYAKKLLTGPTNSANLHKTVIIAESQTAGRGRLGRSFYSSAKKGLYLSVIYVPEKQITDPAKITAIAAVAACRVIKKVYKVNPKIKWINDLYLNQKKFVGILTEGVMNFETGTIDAAVIGIGVNIKQSYSDVPKELENKFGCIQEASESREKVNNISRNFFAAELIHELFDIFDEDTNALMAEYKKESFLIGTKITVHPVIGEDISAYEAEVLDIDEDAGLVVKLSDGTTKILRSGEVSLHQD